MPFVGLYGIMSIEIPRTGMPCCSISICSHPVSTAANTNGLLEFDSITRARTHSIALCQSPVTWL